MVTAAAAVAGGAAAHASAFGRLDELALDPRSFGVIHVALEPDAFAPLGRHVGRRAAELGRPACIATAAPVADPWRDLARRSGVAIATDPVETARALGHALCGSLVVVAQHRVTAWGRAVRDELARLSQEQDRALLVVTLCAHDELRRERPALPLPPAARDDAPSACALVLELEALVEHDVRRWWSAVISQDAPAGQGLSRLASLDGWWQAARARSVDPTVDPPHLEADAATLAAYAAAAEQALAPEQLAELGVDGAVPALVAAGLCELDRQGGLLLADGVPARALAPGERRALARALASAGDAWSLVRAAELVADGDLEQAERLAFAALRCARDHTAREDLWHRWDAIVAGAKTGAEREVRLGFVLRTAEQALELGDGDRADRLARQAMAVDGERFEVLLLHGRASHAREDATTAALALARAMSAAPSHADRARAAGMLAQVRHAAGDPAQAEKYAREAVDKAGDPVTRLDGRNVLGKLLLAQERWLEAEEHFAADAYDAAVVGAREAELRARVNRGIAMLCLGRRDQARQMLEEALADGEREGVLRAVAYTLANLAAIAMMQNEYERALQITERAIEVGRAVSGRLGMVQPVTNLAELRLRLGLVAEAEHGLRFGAHAYGQGLPLGRYAYFAKAMACVHLERGDTAAAQKELATAISGATSARELGVLAQCHRIAARIALEDGDLTRAATAIDLASELRHTAFGQAELAVLRAQRDRAAGEAFLESAKRALCAAQAADDPESLRDARLLLHDACKAAGDAAAAVSHLRAAAAERDRVANALPPALRQRYLSRRALAALHELEAALDDAQPLTPRVQDEPLAPAPRRPAGSRRLVGESAPMRALRGTIKRVAGTDATVLVNGPTGTGKELVAEAIHEASPRRHGPLVKVNCAALVDTLLLSELFGHEKGAFTGASSRRRGRFELAEGGTLFLDEIGDISPRTQVALLRVLQDGTYERVGGCTQLRANVRIVCATHRDLRAMVERGEFREDLYYRLSCVVIEVPALRERVVDLPQLCEALLDQQSRTSGIPRLGLSRDALRNLCRHGWPGNVRELENALRVAALFARGPQIETSDFVEHVENLRYLGELGDHPPSRPSPGSIPPPPDSSHDSLAPPSSSTEVVYSEIRGGTSLTDMKRRLEQECIARALVESGGNITRAAALLGMKRPRLSQLVKQYKLATVLEDIKS
jgi:transcriptional regulator with GAF, ATPase, and Fis domain